MQLTNSGLFLCDPATGSEKMQIYPSPRKGTCRDQSGAGTLSADHPRLLFLFIRRRISIEEEMKLGEDLALGIDYEPHNQAGTEAENIGAGVPLPTPLGQSCSPFLY